jgi:hypothetical protein
MNKKKLIFKSLTIVAVLFCSNLLIAQSAFKVISAGNLGMFIGSNISQPIRAMHVVGELNLTPNGYNNLTYLNVSNPTGNMTTSTTQLYIRGLKSNGSQGSEVNIGTSGFMGVNGLPTPGRVRSCGFLGLSTCSNFRLQVFGNAIANDWYTFSDSSIKENIEPISDVLPNLMMMHPISYNYKPVKLGASDADTSSNDTIIPTTDPKLRFGFTAQEVKRVFPNLEEEYTENLGVVNYVGFIPLLVRGIQEQQKTIDSLNLQIQNLRQEIVNWKGKTLDTPSDQSRLFQNNPNPFDGNTTISYYIDENSTVTTATIEIRNIMGNLITSITLADMTGLGEISYSGSNLSQGYYIYTLKINGSVKDSKMFLKEN